MFDCCFVQSYNQKKRSKIKVIVCRTGLSATWSLGTPPTRRHSLHTQIKSLRMQIVSMLQGMENDGSLPRGSVTAIAKRFGVACCTVHRLWKRAACTRTTGLINSPDFNSRKKIPGGHLFIQQSLFMKVSRTCR